MTKNFSLQPLVDLSHHKSDAATRKFGELNIQQQAEQKKLETLLQFRKDYHEKFQMATRNGIDSAGVTNFQNFLNRLDEAVEQQRHVMEQANLSLQVGKDALREAQQKMKSFDTLAERHAESSRQQSKKTEQRIQDEQAGQLAFRNGQSDHQFR